MLSLCQAWHLGGLYRASPVPFRASYFTASEHPLEATAQRHADRLCDQQNYGLAPFVHSFNTLRDAPWFVPPSV
jgi:hypothetical protein